MAPSQTTGNGTNGTTPASKDDKAVPFQGQQPYGMPNDLVVKGVLDIDNCDERLWVLLSSPPLPSCTSRSTPLSKPPTKSHTLVGPTSRRRVLPPAPLLHRPRLLRQYPARQEIRHPLPPPTHWARVRDHAAWTLALSRA